MAKLKNMSPDRIAEYFVAYLIHRYANRRHVRRVAAWVGMILLGIDRGAGRNWRIPHTRQLEFDFDDRTFKVRYQHTIGNEGGIEIVEVIGRENGEIVLQLGNLWDVEVFYQNAGRVLRDFVQSHRAAVA